MNRLITLFFILILAQASILAQQRTRSKKSKTNVEKFVLAPFPEAIDSDSIKVVTFMEIPYHALQFVKKENSFFSGSFKPSCLTRSANNNYFFICYRADYKSEFINKTIYKL